jgi:RNA polymerase sigma-70 factor (ECF subfamily)
MEKAVVEDLAEIEKQIPDEPDLSLIEEIASGDLEAFEELVRKYDRKLLRIAEKVTLNLEDAEEAVQEAFFKAFQNLHQFQRNSKFSTWLIRIALNESLMKLRKRRQHRETPLEYEDDQGDNLPIDLADWSPNPEQIYGNDELRGIVLAALDKLRPILRATFVLRDLEGLSIDETAATLGLAPAAVKARLVRARLQLREHLSRHFQLSLRVSSVHHPATRNAFVTR